MRRNAKEVKVIHRWKADEFDGEIPIGGDEEMLGTAMKVASQVSGIQDQIAEGVETAMPVIKNAVWLNAHVAGAFLATNSLYRLANKDVTYMGKNIISWKAEVGKQAWAVGSYIGQAIVNGGGTKSLYSSMGQRVRGIATIAGSGLLGFQIAAKQLTKGTIPGLDFYVKWPLTSRNLVIGSYTVAGISYAYSRFMGGR